MHYTGMAAFEVNGRIVWDPVLVVVSIGIGAALGGCSLSVALGGRGFRRQVGAATLLLLAICGHHFTAMGAVTIVPDPLIVVTPSAVPSAWLAIAVALASLAILLFAGAAVAIDMRDRQRAATEGERLRSLANAAIEGLLVCRGDLIVSANESFTTLVGLPTTSCTGLNLSQFLPAHAVRMALTQTPDHAIEAELQRSDGELVPVEVLSRPVEYARQAHYAIAVRDIRARRQAEGQIKFLALHDGLTGLANRTSFNARLDADMKMAAATQGKLAVLCLDLDRFKEVNDLFGHAAGDKRLQDVARIIGGVLDESQLMSRLGGDEFAVLSRVSSAVAAGRLAEHILDALSLDGTTNAGPAIATSIGIALYPDDAVDRTLLLNYADTALYRAKSEGRGTYRFYEDRMGVAVRDRRLIEHDLRHAIARGEMQIVYQPQTRIETGDVFGFEALLRWRHPDRGYVSPATFIPIAEESGLIIRIGEWVLRETCQEAASWPKPLKIAVNVSAVQLHSPHFVRTLHEILFQTELNAARLEIEITETALIRDPARALSTLHQVKTLGVQIAMDDFGTGYSSLSNLRQFPFDKIKIDGSFIKSVNANEQTAAIVRSVLGLGRGLGLAVIAEGVETRQELDFLQGESCAEAQGYLIGRPAPIEAFAEHTHGATVPSQFAAA